MKVRLKVPINGPEGAYRAGQMPDLSERLARQLIRDGHAVKIDAPARAVQAAQPAPKQTRRRK